MLKKEEEHRGPRREAPRESSVSWILGRTAVCDQTTTSRMEVETELEEASAGKTAETRKGLNLGVETGRDRTVTVEMDLQIEGDTNIGEGKILNLQGPGLRSPNPSRIQFQCTNPTPGSKTGVLRIQVDFRGIQKVLQSSRGTEAVMEESGPAFPPSLAAPQTPQTRGKWSEQAGNL